MLNLKTKNKDTNIVVVIVPRFLRQREMPPSTFWLYIWYINKDNIDIDEMLSFTFSDFCELGEKNLCNVRSFRCTTPSSAKRFLADEGMYSTPKAPYVTYH